MNREDIAKTAQSFCTTTTDRRGRRTFEFDFYGLEEFVECMIKYEREVCANICDLLSTHPQYSSGVTKVAADAIRARGKK